MYKGQKQGNQAAHAAENSWDNLLQRRVVITRDPSAAEQKQYQKRKNDDQRRVKSKFGPVVSAYEEGDESWRSNIASQMDKWIRSGSWIMCDTCSRMEARPLNETDISGKPRSHTIKRCKHCNKGVGYPTAHMEDLSLIQK